MPTNRRARRVGRRIERRREITPKAVRIWSRIIELKPPGRLYRELNREDRDELQILKRALAAEIGFDPINLWPDDARDEPDAYIVDNPQRIEEWRQARAIRDALNNALRGVA